MGLVRTILVLVILLILTHVALTYAGVGQGTNVLTNAIYSLGTLLESPAAFLLQSTTVLQNYLNPNSFYVVAISAAALYFIIYLLLGVGRRAESCSDRRLIRKPVLNQCFHRDERLAHSWRRSESTLVANRVTTITYTSSSAFRMLGRRVMIDPVKIREYRKNEYHIWACRRSNDRI
jgi:hypothetical protein